MAVLFMKTDSLINPLESLKLRELLTDAELEMKNEERIRNVLVSLVEKALRTELEGAKFSIK